MPELSEILSFVRAYQTKLRANQRKLPIRESMNRRKVEKEHYINFLEVDPMAYGLISLPKLSGSQPL